MVKRFKGLLGGGEAQSLEDWLQEPEHRREAEQLGKVWQLSGRYKAGYEPDAEAGLERFRERLRKEKEPVSGRRRLLWVLTAVAAAALLFVLWQPWTIGDPGADAGLVFTTEAGRQRTVLLPDGSRVLLNEASRIACQGDWKDSATRQLQLSGEAFFEIDPRPEQPFVIAAEGAEIRVVGTAFNVRAYPQEAVTEVSVESGIVEFSAADQPKKLRLEQRDKGVWEHAGAFYLEANAGLNGRAWRTGRLHFRATPLREVVRDLDHYLDVRLELEEGPLEDCTFNFSDLDSDRVDEALRSMELIFEATLEKVAPGHYRLIGGSCR